jgi:hypothetical protein
MPHPTEATMLGEAPTARGPNYCGGGAARGRSDRMPEELGLSLSSLYRKIEELGIDLG